MNKLSACSIIAEYNPFHNGHRYQINQAKAQSQADVMIAIMSGNWTQRGAPAMIDKWQRTKLALDNGIDLVIELPVQFAVQPADLFAQGGVQIASALQSDGLAFGCEHADWNFSQLSQNLHPDHARSFKDYRVPYAAQYQNVIKQQLGIDISQPNDILALSYAQANLALSQPLQLWPIQRIGSQHLASHLGPHKISSASALREALTKHLPIGRYVPTNVSAKLQNSYRYTWSDWWSLVRYQLLEQSLPALQTIYQMNEGLEYRLVRAALKSRTWEQFLTTVKTKRYSYARLQRLMFYLLINAQADFKLAHPNAIRVLGFNQQGQQYLKQIKKHVSLPLLTNPKQADFEHELKWDVKAGLLQEMISGETQDYYRHPVIN